MTIDWILLLWPFQNFKMSDELKFLYYEAGFDKKIFLSTINLDLADNQFWQVCRKQSKCDVGCRPD